MSANIEARDWTITPRIGGRYAMERIDGYTDAGGDSGTNTVVGSQGVEVAEGRIELALSRLAMEIAGFTGRGGYLARMTTGDDPVEVTLFDTTQNVSTWADDPSSFYAAGNMVVDLPGSAILQIGGQVFFGDGRMSGCEAQLAWAHGSSRLAEAEQGDPAADDAADRLEVDLTVGQCLLQPAHASNGDLSTQEGKAFKTRQFL